MTYASAGAGAGAAAAAAAIAQATKASGAIVRMEPEQFRKILDRAESALVVTTLSKGLFKNKHQYLTNYKGIFFFTESVDPLAIPSKVETIACSKIWIP